MSCLLFVVYCLLFVVFCFLLLVSCSPCLHYFECLSSFTLSFFLPFPLSLFLPFSLSLRLLASCFNVFLHFHTSIHPYIHPCIHPSIHPSHTQTFRPENEEYGENENYCLACIQNMWFPQPPASSITALPTASPAKPSPSPSPRLSRSSSSLSPLALESTLSSPLSESFNPVVSSAAAEQIQIQMQMRRSSSEDSRIHLNGPLSPSPS